MIGQPRVSVTPEFSIYSTTDGYVVECDGAALARAAVSLKDAHAVARHFASERGYTNAGLTEVFGRNRQFIQGPRGGWTRYNQQKETQ